MGMPFIILASASPARRRLLQGAGLDPIVCPSDIDESQIQSKNPAELVQTLAKLKAQSIAERLLSGNLSDGAVEKVPPSASWLVVGCDSVLLVKGEIHGKPADAAEAIARWQKMSGSFGDLYTGHAIIDTAKNKTLVRSQVTRVYFAKVSDREIEAYVATGEPLRCAGCFALEGSGGLLVEKLEGCHTNVIGLSLPLLRLMLGELGYNVADFWASNGGN